MLWPIARSPTLQLTQTSMVFKTLNTPQKEYTTVLSLCKLKRQELKTNEQMKRKVPSIEKERKGKKKPLLQSQSATLELILFDKWKIPSFLSQGLPCKKTWNRKKGK